MYHHTCLNIKGFNNVWAGIIGRWLQLPTICPFVKSLELPSPHGKDFLWPNTTEIAKEQASHNYELPNNLGIENELWVKNPGSIWIPDNLTDLQLCLCALARTDPSGNLYVNSSESNIRKQYVWPTISSDIKAFIAACINCLLTIEGEKLPRPFGPAVHGKNQMNLFNLIISIFHLYRTLKKILLRSVMTI